MVSWKMHWFSAAVGDALANAGDQFMCPKCASKSGVEYKFGLTSVASISDEEDEDCDEDDKQDDFQSKKRVAFEALASLQSSGAGQ